jgi:hypothetical protein
MTTQAILQAIWEYPFLSTVLNRHQYQLDFLSAISNTNAYLELITRADAGTSILERLNETNPVHSREAYTLYKSFEVLISQTELLSQLNNEEKKRLITGVLKNDALLEKNADVIPNINRATSWLLIGKTLSNAGYTPFMEQIKDNASLKMFLESPSYVYMKEVYADIPKIIAEYAEKYLTIRN